MTTYLQEPLDYHSLQYWNAPNISRHEGWLGYVRIIPCHIYGSVETIERFSKREINGTHETLWNVSRMNRKSTIYLKSLVKTVLWWIGHRPTSSLAHH